MIKVFSLAIFMSISASQAQSEKGGTRDGGGGNHYKNVLQIAHDRIMQVFLHANIHLKAESLPTFKFVSEDRQNELKVAADVFNKNKKVLSEQHLKSLEWDFPTPWPYNEYLTAYTNPEDPSEKVHYNLEKLNKNPEGFNEPVAMASLLHELGHKLGYNADDMIDGVSVRTIFDDFYLLVMQAYGTSADKSIIDDYPKVKVKRGASFHRPMPIHRYNTGHKNCLTNSAPAKLRRLGRTLEMRLEGKILSKYVCSNGTVYYGVALYPHRHRKLKYKDYKKEGTGSFIITQRHNIIGRKP